MRHFRHERPHRALKVAAALLASARLAGTPPAAAQERPITLEALDRTEARLQVTGFGVGTFAYENHDDENTFTVSKLSLALYRRIGAHVSVFGQLTTLLEEAEPEGAPDEGEHGGGALETEIDNLILRFTPPGAPALSFWFGRFDAPLGFERDDEPLNLQPTTSFNFEFARPAKFTGAMARYTPVPAWSFALLAVNGWDVARDNNRGKTFGARAEFLPFEFGAVAVTALYGPEKEGNASDRRLLLAGDWTLQPTRAWIFGGEVNFGSEERSAPGRGTATWAGGAATAFVRFGRNLGLTLRYDYLDDRDGARTGADRVLQSFTVAPMLFFRHAAAGIFSTVPRTSFALPAVALRVGVRRDRSSVPFFATGRYRTRAIAEAVVLF